MSEFKNLLNKAVEDGVFPGCNVGIIVKNENGYKETHGKCDMCLDYAAFFRKQFNNISC